MCQGGFVTTLAQLRKAALSCPETVEQVDDTGVVAFLVGDERFAVMGRDKLVELRLPAPDADKVLASHPTARRLAHGATPTGVRVPLGDINGQQLNHWVRRAWLSRAPKALVAQVAAGDT